MSLDARNITQGGQVIKYMISMFIQITNIVVYWSLIPSAGAFFIYLFSVMKWIHIKHGAMYWLLVLKGRLVKSQGDQLYHFNWVTAQGNTVEFTRTGAQVLNDGYFIKCAELLKTHAFFGWGVSLLVFFIIIGGVFWYLGRKGSLQRKDELIGGRYLASDAAHVNKLLKKLGKLSPLKIGDLHLVKNSEVQNIALHGTVGTGKSTVINGLLEQARKDEQRGIIYDRGNNFIPIFYRDGTDVILNPIDERCPNWDLWEECKDKVDLENFAEALFSEGQGGGDPFWVLSARMLFVSTAEAMRNDPNRSIRLLLNHLLSISLNDLKEILRGTDAVNLVDGSIEKTAVTIRTVLATYAKSLRLCQGLDKPGKPKFSIRKWLNNTGDNVWIFLSSDGRVHESIKPLITAWLNIAMQNVLALEADLGRRVWTLLDELPSLNNVPKILEYLSEARKFGGVSLVGIQNFPQLQAIYGKDKAQAIWDLLNTKAYFRAPSGEVARWVQSEIGEIRQKKFKDQYSYGVDTIRDGVNFSKDEQDENIVNYSDIQRLDDLQCYVVLKGDLPVAKVNLTRKEFKKIAEGKIERDLLAAFDQNLDELISHADMGHQFDALANKIVNGAASSSASGSEIVMPTMTAQEQQVEVDPIKQENTTIYKDEEHQNGKVENNLKHSLRDMEM
ncbi:conjugal transfer protein TraD [Rodentibacter sp. JRC1]|uniref:type IV conjugative transfer system coupling protein TraD n=1 Tax=Rodentibacter sp. JRC1 TaxID=2874504 RepID=UPI001CFD9730|nr:type IV conjugative transfer system coupling protein TraD [Rodentibacter sp. JRC1]GJI56971.1 conjugal transfer protein TraD [Rodentibacter sp. JRC1]